MGIIYCVRNKVNGKMYIGKTSKSIESRMHTHWQDRNDGTYFHKALLKYGIDSFNISVIDSCENDNCLSDLEKLYIDMFSTSIRGIGYNTTHGGDGVTLNYEARQKMSRTKRGKPSARRGVPMSESAYQALMRSRIGIWDKHKHPMLGKKQSAESIEKMKRTKAEKIKTYTIICSECGEQFTAHVPFAKYCSNACKIRNWTNRRRKI